MRATVPGQGLDAQRERRHIQEQHLLSGLEEPAKMSACTAAQRHHLAGFNQCAAFCRAPRNEQIVYQLRQRNARGAAHQAHFINCSGEARVGQRCLQDRRCVQNRLNQLLEDFAGNLALVASPLGNSISKRATASVDSRILRRWRPLRSPARRSDACGGLTPCSRESHRARWPAEVSMSVAPRCVSLG